MANWIKLTDVILSTKQNIIPGAMEPERVIAGSERRLPATTERHQPHLLPFRHLLLHS